MKRSFGRQADARYCRLSDDNIVESEEVQNGIVLHCDERGQVIAIEILSLKERVPNLDLNDIKIVVP